MNRARPPREDAYKNRPQDYRVACCVWLVLVASCVSFLSVRTWELKLRLNNSERTVSRLASWDFPRPMLDICEFDVNSSQRLSVLDKFVVHLDEVWGSVHDAELLSAHESIYKTKGDIPYFAFDDDLESKVVGKAPYERFLPKSMQSQEEDVGTVSSEYGYRCVRFKAGNGMIHRDTIWYEAVFSVNLNLSSDDVAQRQKSIISWNNVTVMTDHFFRFSLSDEIDSPLSAKEETLRLSMFPFSHPGMRPENSGIRKLSAVGKPTYHKWTDSMGGRRGAKENDKAILDRSEFNGDTPQVHQGEPQLTIALDIPSCKSLFHLHINDIYSDVLAWMTSVLACFTIFNVMAVLFIPLNDYAPPQKFRFQCCGLGAAATENEKKPLLGDEQCYNDANMNDFDA